MDLLMDAGIGRTEAHNAISALGDVFSPRDLMPGQQITLGLNLRTTIQDAVDARSSPASPAAERRARRGRQRRDDGEFRPRRSIAR